MAMYPFGRDKLPQNIVKGAVAIKWRGSKVKATFPDNIAQRDIYPFTRAATSPYVNHAHVTLPVPLQHCCQIYSLENKDIYSFAGPKTRLKKSFQS
jgi:hypothetical protein